MNALRALLADRRRSQRGSVLSAVLIIVAFLAIIAGALTTEISTNLLLSTDLVNRVDTQATVNSAVELALNRLQNTPLNAPCPSLVATPPLDVSPSTAGGQRAVASYVSCAPVVDVRSPQFVRVAASEPFTVDGTHAQLPGLNDYLVGDAGGTLFDYTYGDAAPRWTLGLGGSVTGSPLAMPDPSNRGQFLDLIPVSGSACAPASFCMSVRSDDGSSAPPDPRCTMAAAAAVESQPAAGRNFPRIAFSGDSSGKLYAIDTTSRGNCDVESSLSTGDPIVAGPVVFPCQNGCGASTPDEVFVLGSGAKSTQLKLFTYSSSQGLEAAGSLALPWANASGIAAEATTLPARLAITFAGGQVAVVQIDAGGNMSSAANVGLPAGIDGAPYWCHCPGSIDLIGVGARNGSLYVFDTSLNRYATYAGGPAIETAPATDAAGDWYFAADDGRLYEVQKPASGTTMVLAASFGSANAAIGSSPVIGGCPAGICVYLGSTDANAYLVTLDARDAVLTACITTAPPSCSGVNPRLWARVEVGVVGNPQEVHVDGWSYYSP